MAPQAKTKGCNKMELLGINRLPIPYYPLHGKRTWLQLLQHILYVFSQR